MKSPAVLVANIDPFIFQSYKSLACFATSWLVLIYAPFKFTWWGMLGALIWVINGVAAVLAVRLVGIGLAQSLWSGLSIFISYIWGAYIFKETVKNHVLSLLALFIMVMGMLGIGAVVSKGKVTSLNWRNANPEYPEECGNRQAQEVFASPSVKDLVDTTRLLMIGGASQKYENRNAFVKGIVLATFVGVLNGSFMVPFKYANKDVVGIEYIVSFGVGAITMTVLGLAGYSLLRICSGYPCPSFQVRKAAGPALLTGLFWSAGNFFSIYATSYLGVALGWPLVQCQLLVSALWAVFYYKEVTSGLAAAFLIGSSLLVMIGAVMLSCFGTVS